MNNGNPNIQVLKASETGIFTNYIYKAIPLAFDESMSYYECLCGLLSYLKDTVIPTVNNNADAIIELQQLYEELKNYVNEYFDNLDVQEEINNKLDKMATDGTFYNLINNELFKDMNNQIVQNAENIGTLNQEMNNTVKTTSTNIITNAMLSQEVREALTGGSTAVVDDNSITTENIQDKAITIYKLDDLLNENFNKEYTNIDYTFSYQGAKYYANSEVTVNTSSTYCYADITLENNTIYYFSGFNNFAIQGLIVVDGEDNLIYKTNVTSSSNRLEKVSLLFRTNQSGLHAIINAIANPNTGSNPASTKILNTLVKLTRITQNERTSSLNLIKTLEGYFINIGNSTSGINEPACTTNINYNVNLYKLSKGVKYIARGENYLSISGLCLTNENFEVTYKSATSSTSPKANYEYEFTASNNGYALLSNSADNTTLVNNIYLKEETNKYESKKWAVLGDSLTDPNTNPTVKKYYSYVEDDLGITIQNLGQSGCGYKRKYNNGNNFVEQSLLLDSDVDVVSIFGSFNDNHEYGNMGTINDTTTDTLLGCVYVTLNNIITNRPNAKTFIILPTPWGSNGSNPPTINYNTNTYLEGIRSIAKKLSIPVLDLFYESNMYPWNDGFKSNYYVSGDGTHPNSDGNKRFAYQIEEFIKKLL